jgi:hypothetical protein
LLNLTVTDNASYNRISNNNYGNLTGLGFFAPTIGQVQTLFYDAGAPPGPFSSSGTGLNVASASTLISALDFITLFGCTAGCGSNGPSTQGYMVSPAGGAQYAWAVTTATGLGYFGMSGVDQFSFNDPSGASHSQVGTGFFLAIDTSSLNGLLSGSEPLSLIPPSRRRNAAS